MFSIKLDIFLLILLFTPNVETGVGDTVHFSSSRSKAFISGYMFGEIDLLVSVSAALSDFPKCPFWQEGSLWLRSRTEKCIIRRLIGKEGSSSVHLGTSGP